MAATGLVAGWIGARALLRTGARLFFVAGAPLLSLVLVLLLLFLLEQRWEARARALGLVCAHCGELLVGGTQNVVSQAVLARGVCPRCQTPLWTDSVSPTARGALHRGARVERLRRPKEHRGRWASRCLSPTASGTVGIPPARVLLG